MLEVLTVRQIGRKVGTRSALDIAKTLGLAQLNPDPPAVGLGLPSISIDKDFEY